MKFAEIKSENNKWTNSTNSYFLLMGIQLNGFPEPSQSGLTINGNGILQDASGNALDTLAVLIVSVSQWTNNMTVWNGTSMVSEPYTQTTSQAFIYQKPSMLVPPGYSVFAFLYGWGFWLTSDEVESYILHGSKLEIKC